MKFIKVFLVALVSALSFLAVSAADPSTRAQSVEQWGITWTFDREYRVGQFVNGDWWVLPDDPDGAVVVVGITPAPSGGRHGSMINPAFGTAQGYDSRVGGYNQNLCPTLPFGLRPDQSLVSTVSRAEGLSRPSVKTAAILTCLATAPAAGSFRPPYTGAAKPLHNVSALREDLLPKLLPVDNTPALATVERYFERPWLDHKLGWTGAAIHPLDNMQEYGRNLSSEVGVGALMLTLDPAQIGDRRKLLIRFVQLGIDFYGIAANGGYWPCNGGHASGRKFPILFAGYMLNDHDMFAIGHNEPTLTSWRFGEDDQTFYVTEGDLARQLTCMKSGAVLAASGNTVELERPASLPSQYLGLFNGNKVKITGGTGAGQVRRVIDIEDGSTFVTTIEMPWDVIPDTTSTYTILGYEEEHIGIAEWGILHFGQDKDDNPSWKAAYRTNGTACGWVGWVLAARIHGIKDAWNHNALFDYQDRHMRNEAVGTLTRSWSRFSEKMWDTYRAQFDDRVNTPPKVNAGKNVTITLPQNSVVLTGTVTDDGLPNPPGAVSVTWGRVGGYLPMEFSDPHSLATTVTFSVPGTYYIKLTATDGEFTVIDKVAVKVLPAPEPVFGDINDDGVVNFADLNILLANYGRIGDDLPGDLNFDGKVDFSDLNIMLELIGG